MDAVCFEARWLCSAIFCVYIRKSLVDLGVGCFIGSLLSFSSHRYTRSSLKTLSRPYLTSRLKIANRSYSALVLWNSLPSDLRHVAHHVTPSPILN